MTLESGVVIQHGESAAKRRLSDVSRAEPGDASLQNLLTVLVAKLDSCRRLPILEYEAASEGHAACEQAFRELAEVERRSINRLLACLELHLAEVAAERAGAR